MLCWGSWANTQKLAGKQWRFQLFYWDYAIGVFMFSLGLALTLGSMGKYGRGFVPDLMQADPKWLGSALIGGIVFNLSNILLVAAIDITGMAVAFPVGVGLALVIGVVTTYLKKPEGNVPMLATGVLAIVMAIFLASLAYKRLPKRGTQAGLKGILLSIVAGLLMGMFYSFVVDGIGQIDRLRLTLEPGKLSPYTALVMFSAGVLLSNCVWNTLVMVKPFVGDPVPIRDYFIKGNTRLHLIGILGGVIWNAGLSANILSNNAANPTLSYGLGQCAAMIGAMWGVFIWKEFKGAPQGTNKFLVAMFVFYFLGLGILIASKLI